MAPNLAKAGPEFSAVAFLEYVRGERHDRSHVSKPTHVTSRSILNGNERPLCYSAPYFALRIIFLILARTPRAL